MGTARHREMVLQAESDEWHTEYNYSMPYGTLYTVPGPMSLVTEDGNDYASLIETVEMDDVVTPGFKKLQAQGVVINNPLTKVHLKSTIPVYQYSSGWTTQLLSGGTWYDYATYDSHGTVPMNMLSTHLPSPSVNEDHAKQVALTSAWASIGGDQMLALASLAEAEDAVVGLSYILKKVYRLKKAIRKANFKALKDELKPSELAEIYMNARYNLRPLYYDAKAITAVITEPLAKARRQTFRGYYHDEAYDSDELSDVTLATSTFGATLRRSASTSIEVRAGVLCEADPGTYTQVLGVDKLAETAWDLTPGSFIYDWFLNIGDTIMALTPVAGFSPLSSWTTVVKTEIQKMTLGAPFTWRKTESASKRYQNIVISASSLPYEVITVTKTRVPSPDRSLIPTWDVKLDPLKLLDLAIILKKVRSIDDLFNPRVLNPRNRHFKTMDWQRIGRNFH